MVNFCNDDISHKHVLPLFYSNKNCYYRLATKIAIPDILLCADIISLDTKRNHRNY